MLTARRDRSVARAGGIKRMRDTPQNIGLGTLAAEDVPAIESMTSSGMRDPAMYIDKQRIAAVRVLEALGYSYRNNEWLPPAAVAAAPLPLTVEADAMHGALMRRADALVCCAEGTHEEAELKAIGDLLEAYEAKRWPDGKEPGGKG
jgi:hypothetical protein